VDVSGLDAALAGVRRICLDSSTCIAYHSTSEPVHPLARHLLHRIVDPEDPLLGYLSALSGMELLIRPIRAGGADLSFMHAFLGGFPNLHALPIDLDVALQAANVRALSRLPTADSLLIASAMLANCGAIVTNDGEWHRRLRGSFPQFRWVYLAE
jgi:predicted nucleic acid-binding protein